MSVCGDGGMVTTNNEEIKNKIESLRDNGRTTRTEYDKLGFTMRLNTVSAAIGRIQLHTLDEKNKIFRRELASMYKKFLGDDYMLNENTKGTSVYHQIIIKHKKRDEILSWIYQKIILEQQFIIPYQFINNHYTKIWVAVFP